MIMKMTMYQQSRPPLHYSNPDSSRTVTHTISNWNGQGLEYSDVANPSPPTPNKSEHKKTNSVRKEKCQRAQKSILTLCLMAWQI